MLIAWATDVHLDAAFSNPTWLAAFFTELEKADALLLSGDIANGRVLGPALRYLDEHFQGDIYFVLGNHDAYTISIAKANSIAKTAAQESPTLHWLDGCQPRRLAENVGLVGVGGWGDGRTGDFFISGRHLLNDYVEIAELRGLSNKPLLKKLNELGDTHAKVLKKKLDQVPTPWTTVYVLTHVPPWREAAWYNGRLSDDEWSPHFTCIATGSVIQNWADAHPEVKVIVLCGHTHGQGFAKIRPNVVCWTGQARYHYPAVERWITPGEEVEPI